MSEFLGTSGGGELSRPCFRAHSSNSSGFSNAPIGYSARNRFAACSSVYLGSAVTVSSWFTRTTAVRRLEGTVHAVDDLLRQFHVARRGHRERLLLATWPLLS